MAHIFTPEEAKFIRENVEGRGNQELTDLFNAHFNLNLSLAQIKGYKKNHGLTSGLTGWFKPGQAPFNKGRKGVFLGGEVAEACQFKKGHKAWNWVPIGSERVNADGYVDVKVADGQKQKNWKGKHILIWEEHNGPVPPGHAVIFGDRNRRNFDPENLLLVSRAQLVRLNQCNIIQSDTELTKTGIIIADIHNKIGERKRAKA
jgi:hypothetical protein